MAQAPQTTTQELPVNGQQIRTEIRDKLAQWMEECFVQKSTTGSILAVAGVYLLLMGKKRFKLFLGTVGAICGGWTAFFVLNLIRLTQEGQSFGPNQTWIYVGLIGVAVIGGAIASIVLLNYSIYATAAAGGAALGSLISSAMQGILGSDPFYKQIIIVSCTILISILVRYFEDTIIALTSACVGSISLTLGYDLLFGKGNFARTIVDSVPGSGADFRSALSGDAMQMVLLGAGVALFGFIYQVFFVERLEKKAKKSKQKPKPETLA